MAGRVTLPRLVSKRGEGGNSSHPCPLAPRKMGACGHPPLLSSLIRTFLTCGPQFSSLSISNILHTKDGAKLKILSSGNSSSLMSHLCPSNAPESNLRTFRFGSFPIREIQSHGRQKFERVNSLCSISAMAFFPCSIFSRGKSQTYLLKF